MGNDNGVSVKLLPALPDEYAQQPTRSSYPKRLRSWAKVTALGVNLLVASCPFYFVVFGLLVAKQNLQAVESSMSRSLLQAALYGPTIFPVIFAAIVGKTLKSIADWKLEQGTTIATLEYLLASRTVSGALIAPIRFRVAHVVVLPLVLLWAMSPLGSQASLRVISTTTISHTSQDIITYLDVNGSQPVVIGNADRDLWINAISATFNSVVFAAATAKDAAQDPYGHVKIPMVEALTRNATSDGWHLIQPQDYNTTIYSSLIGLPTTDVPYADGTGYSIETSYFAVNCSLSRIAVTDFTPVISTWRQLNPYNSSVAYNGDQMSIEYDLAHYNDTSRPRNLTLWSLDGSKDVVSVASCVLTTTYVEAQISCLSKNCNATAVRPSTLSWPDRNWSGLDDLGVLSSSFFASFVNSSTRLHIGTSSPIEFYLNNPRSAINPLGEVLLADVDAGLFSQRFAQLLNSFWLITLTPTGAFGQDFTKSMQQQLTAAKNVTSTAYNNEVVVLCNKAWLGVLLGTSFIMLLAGILTTTLDAMRAGPEVLDLAVSLVRDNPFSSSSATAKNSLETGADQVRRLRETHIRFGDVQAKEATGYAAVSAGDRSTVAEGIQYDRQFS